MKIKGSANLDLSDLTRIIKRVQDTDKYEGRFGVVDTQGNPNHQYHSEGGTIHQIALKNHNGDLKNTLTIDGVTRPAPIPPRPFFYRKAVEKKSEWGLYIQTQVLNPIFSKKKFGVKSGVKEAAARFGEDIRISLIQWSEPPNADYTIEQKGFDDPLVETGLLMRSIKGVVIDK